MFVVHKITPAHDAVQDRIRLALQAQDGAVRVLWLTHRLATRTVLALARWLDQEVKPQVLGGAERAVQVQRFEQGAAVSRHAPQPPVVAQAAADGGLVERVDLGRQGTRFVITFVPLQGDAAQLNLDDVQLRQVLDILRRVFAKAEWSVAGWPSWLANAPATGAPPASSSALH